jgi:hypothetical protein|tara:strand:- start:896 stop:1075 length:180 start_codon:yes stop_codon:yes gene_type:complete
MAKKTIVATQILVQWSDSSKLVICNAYMPDYVQQPFDEWLSEIEHERNVVDNPKLKGGS